MSEPQRIEPAPGQESVWDYPRPPAIVPTERLVRVEHAGAVIAETRRAIRVLETSQAPAFYIPPDDVDWRYLDASDGASFCEWKGQADYLAVVVGDQRVVDAAWRYRSPTIAFESIRDHLAFYPQKVTCSVDGEVARPMPGGFYGGWITDQIVGPFKGATGTAHW
jgi:uncharacterized protein (DUF427 family)